MFRGTTPTLTFRINTELDLSTITDIYITIKAKHGDKVREYEMSDVEINTDEKKIYLPLTQEDTLYFNGGKTVMIQIRIKDENENAYTSDIKEAVFDQILKDGEI